MKYNRFMGEYDPNTEYEKLDVVTFEGDAYYRTKAGKGVSPIGKTIFKTWSKLNQTLAEALNLTGGKTSGGSNGTGVPTGGVSYTEGYRISASSGEVSANAATDLTDFIAVSAGDKVELYGMVMPADTANVGVHFYADDKTTKLLSMVGADAFPHGDWTYTMQGDNVIMFVVPEWSELDNVAYMRIVASDINAKSAIVVTHNEQEGGSGLPETTEPYMQLVTDGEGKAGWEERLAWKEEQELFSIKDYTLNFLSNSFDAYTFSWMEEGKKYSVVITTPRGETKRFNPQCELSLDGTLLEFACEYTDDLYTLRFSYNPQDGSSTILDTGEGGVFSIFVGADKTIHPIPAEYLPGYFKLFVVTAANDGDFENNTYTANMARDEAMAVLQNYPFAVMKAGNHIYWLSIVLIQNDMFIMTFYDKSGELEVTLMYNADGTIVFFNP